MACGGNLHGSDGPCALSSCTRSGRHNPVPLSLAPPRGSMRRPRRALPRSRGASTLIASATIMLRPTTSGSRRWPPCADARRAVRPASTAAGSSSNTPLRTSSTGTRRRTWTRTTRRRRRRQEPALRNCRFAGDAALIRGGAPADRVGCLAHAPQWRREIAHSMCWTTSWCSKENRTMAGRFGRAPAG